MNTTRAKHFDAGCLQLTHERNKEITKLLAATFIKSVEYNENRAGIGSDDILKQALESSYIRVVASISNVIVN